MAHECKNKSFEPTSSTALVGQLVIGVSPPRFSAPQDVAKDFVTKFNLELICRSHEVVEDGVAYFADRSVVTPGWTVGTPGDWEIPDLDGFQALGMMEESLAVRNDESDPNEPTSH